MEIMDVLLTIIPTYVQDRVQLAKVNGVGSRIVKTNVGVPEGSILVPQSCEFCINYLLSLNQALIAYAALIKWSLSRQSPGCNFLVK